MARIKTYDVDTNISDIDIVIGTDGDNYGTTKNFQVSDLRQYLLSGLEPESGGNLKITTIVDNSSEYTTPESYFNNSDTPIIVLNYEIVFLILNGRTFIFRKNNDVYGIGETQVISSDFTEIDITSVVNSSIQGLDSVLDEGNVSIRDAKIGTIYLYDSYNSDGYVSISGSDDRFTFFDKDNKKYLTVSQNVLELSNFALEEDLSLYVVKPTITGTNKTAAFQNASGIIAYLSDIDAAINEIEVPVLEIESSDDTISVINTGGVIDLSLKTPYVLNTLLRDSLTNTTYYQKGGYFEYDTGKYPVDSIRLDFNYSVGSPLNPGENLGVVYFMYEEGFSNYYYMNIDDAVISGSSITVPFPLDTYWVTDEGQRLSTIEINLFPNSVKAVGGFYFNGCISGAISKYIYKWYPRLT